MFENATPEKAIEFTRLCVTLNCCWPLPPTATRLQVLRFNLQRVVTVLSVLTLFVPLVYSIYVNWNNMIILTKVVCFIDAFSQILIQTLFSVLHHDRTQRLVQQMTEYCANAKSYERSILQQYVDKYSMFYGTAATWFYSTTIIFVVGTLFISQPFPVDAEYPFPVDYEPLRTTIFLHHCYVGLQCAAIVCTNVFAALLLLFAAARFEILMVEFRAVRDVETLRQCVRKYYRVRSYAKEVVNVIQYTAICTTLIATLPLVFCGLNIIGRQPPLVKVQFAVMAGTALLEVFMCAWPADNLMEVSEKAVRSFYESTWYDDSMALQRNLVMSLLPQRPITISLACFIPVMSLKYYCSYVSNAFSLFTALRLALNHDG
ncbi:odorant receptor 4-like [Colletes gigas]|uniref:odorant receptor 4-like n=1 Tax=Colletes gigas TaxID=935657 RepID=UPI001C9A74BD|nr:odorant receptor 4-like [Colletes gigas]